MSEKIKVGIIGCGGISHSHMAGYKALPDRVDVAAVCDIDEAKVKAYAERYNVPHWYTDAREMLANETLDAVSVCTWNSAHCPMTVLALEAGVNVLCEKPMAMNQEEAQLMLDTAKRCGKLLQIGFVRRFGNDAEIVKKFIDAGDMGDLYYAKATYLRRNGCPGGWFGDKAYSGGGPLIDLGVHVMDLVRYLGGCPNPISAYGVTFNNLGNDRASGEKGYVSTSVGKYEHNVEDMASAMIRFDNGLVLSVEASFNLNIKSDTGTIELFGTKSGAKLDPGIQFFTDMNGMFVDVTPSGNTALSFNGLFEREIAHYVDCVQNGTPCRAPAEDGVMLMKMIDAIYASAECGHEVVIG
ncbi:MAG: Gfo/Idh/MocA family oxidoreductase [Clostridia bacterium]|nr:Gfo/Idh/MocA family oxidoreductase [Clostridia bacterium]